MSAASDASPPPGEARSGAPASSSAGRRRGRRESTSPDSQAAARHVQTEQARRDRIKDGFDQLRDLLPVTARNSQRADLLTAAATALRGARRAAAALHAAGLLRTLPDDAAFALRSLLPADGADEPEPAPVSPPAAAAPAPAALAPQALLAAALAADGGATALHMLMAAAYAAPQVPAEPPVAPVAKRARVDA